MKIRFAPCRGPCARILARIIRHAGQRDTTAKHKAPPAKRCSRYATLWAKSMWRNTDAHGFYCTGKSYLPAAAERGVRHQLANRRMSGKPDRLGLVSTLLWLNI